MKRFIYLTLDVVLAIHDDMVERYGGHLLLQRLGFYTLTATN